MKELFHNRTAEQCIDDATALSEQIDLALVNLVHDADGNLHRSDANRIIGELLVWLKARVGEDAYLSWKTVLEAVLEHGDTRPKAIRAALFCQASMELAAPRLARKALSVVPDEA